MASVLGVDVGGTKVAAAPVDRNGKMLAPPLVERSETASEGAFLAALADTLGRALRQFEDSGVMAVGLACAGTMDVTRGVAVTSPNLPLVEAPVVKSLEDALDVPVVLENDANAALWAESVVGAAIGLRHVVMLTLGTGVGGALLLDGQIYRGAGGGAGEFGHTTVLAGGLPCRCGARGCLEMYAAGEALVRYASARVRDTELDPQNALLALRQQGQLTGGAIARLAAQGHPGALEAVQQLASWLGIGLLNISNVFNPEMIIVGGGVGEVGEPLLRPAREFLHKNAMTPGRDQVRVVPAQLGNQAGLVGAGLLGWETVDASGGPIARAGA
jgi:glucokinase